MAWSAEQQQLTPEQYQVLAQKSTPVIITFFNKLIEKNIFGIQHLKQLEKAETLINPITKEERVSITVLPWATQLDGWLKYPVHIKQINVWATEKIAELKHEEKLRAQAAEDTKDLHNPIRFVPLTPGIYTDDITHQPFAIPRGVEIQKTLVTQWQWAHVMESNPSIFVEDPNTEEVIINGKTIKMLPDAPVNNISWNDIQEFIKKLNVKCDQCVYALPSIHEFQALIQKHAEFSATYGEIRGIGWVTSESLWQFTRDDVQLNNKTAHLIFWGRVILDTAVRGIQPIAYNQTQGKHIGFRLVRLRKNAPENAKQNHYEYATLKPLWDAARASMNENWYWDEVAQAALLKNEKLQWELDHINDYPTSYELFEISGLDWMFKNKREFPAAIQHTVDAILNTLASWEQNDPIPNLLRKKRLFLTKKEIIDISPLAYFKDFGELGLDWNAIKDIRPLAHLTKLFYLDLGPNDNSIQDISPLAGLTELERLDLRDNQIHDLSPLAHLTKMRDLALHNNTIQDISPLKNLTKLNRLFLSDNDITDISAIAPLTNLETLSIYNNHINDINALGNLHKLKDLYADNNHIQDVGPLEQLTLLNDLRLDNNQIRDVRPLINLKKLGRLDIDQNPIEDTCVLDELHGRGKVPQVTCLHRNIALYFWEYLVPGIKQILDIFL